MKPLSFRQARQLRVLRDRCAASGHTVDTTGLDGRTIWGFVRRGYVVRQSYLARRGTWLAITEEGHEALWLRGEAS